MFNFTPEQTKALPNADAPVSALDPQTKKEYVILQRDAFEKIKQVLSINEIDPSFFEFEELDNIVHVRLVRCEDSLPFSFQ